MDVMETIQTILAVCGGISVVGGAVAGMPTLRIFVYQEVTGAPQNGQKQPETDLDDKYVTRQESLKRLTTLARSISQGRSSGSSPAS